MAKITNYTTLVENLIAVTEDDGDEFAAYLPTAIALAEERLIKENDWPELSADTTGTLTPLTPDAAIPNNHNYINYFYVTIGDKRKLLQRKTDDFLVDYWPDLSITGEPKYYSYNGNSGELKVIPPTDDNINYTIRSVNAPANLSAINPTNIFIEEAPELLFHACMVECVKFLKMWGQIQVWEQAYQTSREGWLSQTQRQRRDAGETPHNPDGGPNTYFHTSATKSSS